MENILQNKVCVVTGGGRGIGRAIAIIMARNGGKVVVNDLGVSPSGIGSSPLLATQVVEEINNFGGTAVANTDTVATAKGAENIINTAIKTFGTIDILVNNAGIIRDRMIFHLTDEDWDMVIKVNLYGCFYCTRMATKIMREQLSGTIVNISSAAGLGRTLGCSNYSAAKEGIIGLTRSVARDMAKYNVTCNAIRPLAVTRHFDQKRKEAWLRQGKDKWVKEMERSRTEDVAAFVTFLSSEKATSITGRTFFVGGGKVSIYSEPDMIKTISKDNGLTVEELMKILPKSLLPDIEDNVKT